MKKIILFVLLFIYQNNFGQELSLKIISEDKFENLIIDSLGYNQKHINTKSINTEVQKFSNQLLKIGYLETQLIDSKKINDTLFQFNLKLGVPTKFIHIYIGKNQKLPSLQSDTLKIPIHQIEHFLNQQISELESKGFSLARLKLTDFVKTNNQLYASLKIETDKKRTLNEIVINGYDKFPKSHTKNIKRLYRKKAFNKNNLEEISNHFNSFRFVSQTRYPEILFTEDSTKIYIYLEKAKANKFDGHIGFTNDKNNKLQFTGYLDLSLKNLLNSGETFSIYWKSDTDKQVTFNSAIELPYLFDTPIGMKANLNIFKQDSTFQNTKTALDIGYYFTNNKKIYLGYQATESSNIQNSLNSLVSDFKTSYITSSYEYTKYSDAILFPEKTKIILKSGLGSRDSKLNNVKQTFIELDASHTLNFNKRNSIHVRSQNFYLQSSTFLTNELYRFGGIQSIRGFNENSLQGNVFTSLLTEYRYTLSENIYIHSVLDYGFYEDQTTSTSKNPLGIGFGIGILTKNGFFNLIYANGSMSKQALKSDNSIVQIKYSTTF